MKNINETIKNIKNFKGILNKEPKTQTQKIATSVAGIIFGMLFITISSWLLFFKLQVLQYPELIKYFPGAYFLLLTILIMGIYFLIKGITKLIK